MFYFYKELIDALKIHAQIMLDAQKPIVLHLY